MVVQAFNPSTREAEAARAMEKPCLENPKKKKNYVYIV
jgi:hypothetical protein